MIAKSYRLKENEVKKVLRKRKPFFSEHLIANIDENTRNIYRIGIVLSGKQAPGSVNRNTFRRIFYDTARPYLDEGSLDIVLVCKKGVILDRKNPLLIELLKRDIRFIFRSQGREKKKG